MKREATISADGLYRYDLTRTVQPGCECYRCSLHRSPRKSGQPNRPGFVLWVLCNPSTADAETDDPTERRGWGYTSEWGYGVMRFVNTNPTRGTDPKKARSPPELVLSSNDLHLVENARRAALIVCAWGTSADPVLTARTRRVLSLYASTPLCVLALTNNGTPKHPLYLGAHLRPTLWTP